MLWSFLGTSTQKCYQSAAHMKLTGLVVSLFIKVEFIIYPFYLYFIWNDLLMFLKSLSLSKFSNIVSSLVSVYSKPRKK